MSEGEEGGRRKGTRRREGRRGDQEHGQYLWAQPSSARLSEGVSKHMHERYDDRCSRRARERGSTGESPRGKASWMYPPFATLERPRVQTMANNFDQVWQRWRPQSSSSHSILRPTPPPPPSSSRPCHNLKHPVLPLALLVVVAVVDIVRVRVRLSPFLCLRLGGHWYWFGPSAKQLTSSSE